MADLTVRVNRFEEDLRDGGLLLGTLDAGSPSPSPPMPRKVTLVDTLATLRRPFRSAVGRRTEEELLEIRRGFGRFVDLLQQQQQMQRLGREGSSSRGSAAALRHLSFSGVNFGTAGGFRDEDVARLFGEVLPALFPDLEWLSFHHSSCVLPAEHLIALLQRITAASTAAAAAASSSSTSGGRQPNGSHRSGLSISDCSVSTDALVPHVAELIRSSAPIENLVFLPRQSLGREACRQIFGSLTGSNGRGQRMLRRLDVRVERVFEGGALVLPADPARSSLRRLCLRVDRWNSRGKRRLARQLRTNTALTWLRVVFGGAVALPHRPWVDVLQTYNFTLLALMEESCLGPWAGGPMRDGRVAALLRRNERIRQMLEGLEGGYGVVPASLLSLVLELVSSLPALLYRFLRRGDVNALVDRLLPNAAAAHHQEQEGRLGSSVDPNRGGGNATTTRRSPTGGAPISNCYYGF